MSDRPRAFGMDGPLDDTPDDVVDLVNRAMNAMRTRIEPGMMLDTGSPDNDHSRYIAVRWMERHGLVDVQFEDDGETFVAYRKAER